MGTRLEDAIIKPKSPFLDVVRAHQGDPEEVEASHMFDDQNRGRFEQDVEESPQCCITAGE